MQASLYFYSVFLFQITKSCPIPPLARFLYEPPTITSPKENGMLLQSEIKFLWIPATQRKGKGGPSNSSKNILYKLEVRAQISGKNSINEYETQNLFILLPPEKYLPGKYQARTATVGRFGSGKWSKTTKFKIIDSQKNSENPSKKPTDPQVPIGTSKQAVGPTETHNGNNLAPTKPIKTKPSIVLKVTEKPLIILPENGDTIEIGDIYIHWTQVLNVSGYIAQLKHVDSGKKTDFRTKKLYCDNCKTSTIGMYRAKVAKILHDGRVDWGPEIQFEVVDHLKAPWITSQGWITHGECSIEFEWTKIDEALKYELLITNQYQNFRVETCYTFYNMWQFRYVWSLYTVKVAAIDSFRASDWSLASYFSFSYNSLHYPALNEKLPNVHDFTFQPVSKGWMLEKCDLFMGNLCDKTIINRRKVIPITKSNRAQPNNIGLKIGDANGNTFFAAISHAISYSSNHYVTVRNFVVNEITKQQDMYLRNGADLEQYFAERETNKDAIPPTDIEIVATANALRTTIWIYDFHRTNNT